MTPRHLVLALAAALSAFPAWASATIQSGPELLDLDLDDLLKVEVKAASWNTTSLREATASVTVFERRDLERMGLRYLHEVLNFVPGAYTSRVATTGLENRTVLRGNPGTAGGGLLAIDGQRVNTMQSARAWGVLRNFPLALVDRIEIIRGPAGARFGGGPSDEVVHVVTRRGESAASASVGSDSSLGTHVLWGATRGEWRIDLRASHADNTSPEYTGLFDRFGRVDRSRESSETRSGLLDVARGRHGLQVAHHESNSAGYYGLNGSINPGDESLLEATWWRYNGSVVAGAWTLDGFASELRQRYAQGAVALPDGSGPFRSGDFRQRGVLTHRATAGGLTAQRHFGQNVLTLGAETQVGRATQADLQANYRLGPPFTFLGGLQSTGLRFVAEGARERMSGLYGEFDWRVRPEHRVVLGLRRDDYSQSGASTSPRASWVWTPNDHTSIKLLHQEAFFAPTLGQLYLQNNPVIAGAPDLMPTTVATTELVGQYQFDTVLLRGTLYRRDADDGFIVIPRPGVTATTVNAVEQESAGFEGSLVWTPNTHWRLRLTGSTLFTDRYRLPANIAEAPPAAFISKHTASLLAYWTPTARLNLNLGTHWRSAEALQATANDPRTLLQLNWRPHADARVWLHVDNLFKARGVDIDVAGGLGLDPRTGRIARDLPLPGREWQMGVEWRWR